MRNIAFCLRTLFIFSVLTVITASVSFASNDLFKVYYRIAKDGTVNVYADNSNYCPYQVKLNFKMLRNLEHTEPLEEVYCVDAQEKEFLITSLKPVEGKHGNFNYSYIYYMGNGDHTVHNDNFMYQLPYSNGSQQLVSQGYHGKYTHEGKNAIDFKMPEGTPIQAARGGVVVSIKQNSNVGGPSPIYMHDANYVTIYHSDGTFADYLHMQYQSSNLKIGDVVRAGQTIGRCGNTGYSTAAHLHFQVYIPGEKEHTTLPTLFKTKNGPVADLKEMAYYEAFHTEDELMAEHTH